MQTYFLDTSVVRSKKSLLIAEKSKTTQLVASPFAFWEIASHLGDKKENQAQFQKFKSILMKFKHIRILELPKIKKIMMQQIYGEMTNIEEPDLIYAALAALEESDSVNDFYRCTLKSQQGSFHAVSGCIKRIKDLRDKEEKSFISYTKKIIDLIKQGEISLHTPEDIHKAIIDLINGWWILLGKNDNNHVLYAELVDQTYFYFGYWVYRIINYTKINSKLDVNDFGDSELCLHFGIKDRVTIVTGDKGQLMAISETIKLITTLDCISQKSNIDVCSANDAFPENKG